MKRIRCTRHALRKECKWRGKAQKNLFRIAIIIRSPSYAFLDYITNSSPRLFKLLQNGRLGSIFQYNIISQQAIHILPITCAIEKKCRWLFSGQEIIILAHESAEIPILDYRCLSPIEY